MVKGLEISGGWGLKKLTSQKGGKKCFGPVKTGRWQKSVDTKKGAVKNVLVFKENKLKNLD